MSSFEASVMKASNVWEDLETPVLEILNEFGADFVSNLYKNLYKFCIRRLYCNGVMKVYWKN